MIVEILFANARYVFFPYENSQIGIIYCNQRGEINVANLWRHIQYVSHVKRAF